MRCKETGCCFFVFLGKEKKMTLIGIKKNKTWLVWLHFPCDRKGDLIIEASPRGVEEKKMNVEIRKR
jgi:hypothetical protein